MSEQLKIVEKENNKFDCNWKIEIGDKTVDLLSRLSNLDQDEKDTLISETQEILSKCINPKNTIGSITGIAIGYVQSGKTMSFTTLTAMAADNGFKIVIYFAGIKKNLLEQTTKRLKSDLQTQGINARKYKVYQSPTVEEDFHIKISNSLKLNNPPTILITVLKRYDHIDELTKMFKSNELKESIGNNGVLIIDDEADQASLNTYARKNSRSEDWEDDEFSSTYSSILNLKSSIINHSYIQYTATPQGPLLVNLMDLLSPKFHKVLTPGKNYTGGRSFFEENPDLIITIPEPEVYHQRNNPLTAAPQSLIESIQVFLINVAIYVNILKKEDFLSMMIHADREIDASEKFYDWVRSLKSNWEQSLDLDDNDPIKMELIKELKKSYEESTRKVQNPPEFTNVLKEFKQVLLDTNIQLIIGGANEIDWSNESAYILIGAEMLNRGYTIEKLAVSYMPRYSTGRSNADTIQQRCRFFGYKKDYLNICRVYLPNESILEYKEYVQHEDLIRNKLKETTLEQIEQLMILNGNINPTRNNILSNDVVRYKLNGWRQYNALQHIEENISFIQNFLRNLEFEYYTKYGTDDRNHRYVKLPISEVIKFLNDFKIANMPDALRKSSTIQYLRYLADKKGVSYAYIFEMSYAFDIKKGRGTSIIEDNNMIRLSNIFTGRSTNGLDIYPGDREIKFEDSLCIQIHKIKIRDNRPTLQWGGKILYTLGIYYPEAFSHNFITVQ